jgi:carotenoid cleavage dioxygenase-like enzyme
LFALKEDAQPILLDPATLETKGSWNFGGKLTSKTFTAHPKKDPLTGEMLAFGYNTNGSANNLIDVMTISPLGEITRYETLQAPYCSMVHDYLVSRNYLIFTICPMTNDMARVKRGLPFWHWDPRLPTMLGVIPREGGVKAVRWFKAPATVMETHTFNAWEEGSMLYSDHFINTSGWLSQFPNIVDPDAHEAPPYAERWSVDMSKPDDGVRIKRIFNHIGEMPVIDPRYLMRRNQHFYFGTSNKELGPMLEPGPKGPPFTCLGHYHEGSDALDFYYAGPHSSPEEPCFVPKPGGTEGEGWLLTVVGRRAENRSDLVILDANCLAKGPVATVKFPCRIHEGFHGIWISEDQLKMAGSW